MGSHGPDAAEDAPWNHWNYKQNGANWGDPAYTNAWVAGEGAISNKCDQSNQSPIHLYTRADERWEDYEEPAQSENNDNEQTIINGLHDSFSADYYDVKNGYAAWNGHVAMLDLRDQFPQSSFESSIGSEHYGGEREWFAS